MSDIHEIDAVSVVLRRAETVLLVRRASGPNAGLFAFPGGRVEAGETYEAAARRELLEETRLNAGRVTPFREIVIATERDSRPVRYRLKVFLAGDMGGDPVADTDAAEAGFFSLACMTQLPVTVSTLEIARELLENSAG